jgi:hypothetical protein
LSAFRLILKAPARSSVNLSMTSGTPYSGRVREFSKGSRLAAVQL